MSIRELANQLNLSIGTISRALNDRPDVSAKTRARVLKKAEEIGYAPNISGSSLRLGTTNTIGFMIETRSFASVHGESFFMTVFDGVQTLLSEHNVDLVVLLCGSQQRPLNYLKRIVNRRFIDGIILSGIQSNDARIDYLQEKNMPFAALGRSGDAVGYPWIDLDVETMAYDAVTKLVDLGHKQIALIKEPGELNVDTLVERVFRQTIKAKGLEVDESLIFIEEETDEGGYRAVERMFEAKRPPTACFVLSEIITIGMYRKLSELGLTPGKDLAIIGQRDNPILGMLSPALSSFSVDLHSIGERLGTALLANMPQYADRVAQRVIQQRWPMTLVEKESQGG